MNTEKIIADIENSIKDNYKLFTSMGVFNGLAGVSLFYYYLGDLTNSFFYLEKSIEGLNEEYKGDDILMDIIEIGILLNFYCEKKILSFKDVADYFKNYDPIIESFAYDSLKEDNLSPMTGILKYTNYFINQTNRINKKYNYLFSQVVEKIEKLSIKDTYTNGIYWVSSVNRNGKNLIELGIRHGIMGIIDSLVSLYEIGVERNRILELIKQGMKYMESKKLNKKYAYFPFCTDNVLDSKSFSFNLNYGDLGISYGIYRIIEKCNLTEYKSTLLEILEKLSTFRDDENKIVTDANLCYGCIGIASLLAFFKYKLNLPFLDDSVTYWYRKVSDNKIHNTKWAGFDSTFNKFDINSQLSMSHGIVGIGIGLLNKKYKDFSFLNFLGYKI